MPPLHHKLTTMAAAGNLLHNQRGEFSQIGLTEALEAEEDLHTGFDLGSSEASTT